MHRRYKRQEEGAVDMTPMLDIVFILLIFFIVTAKIITFQGVDLTQSDCVDCPAPPISNTVVLYLDEQSRVQTDNRRIGVREAPAIVETLRAQKPGASVILRVHPEANHGDLIFLQDALKQKAISSRIEIVKTAEK